MTWSQDGIFAHCLDSRIVEKFNLEDNDILDERPGVCHLLPVFMTKAATNPTLVRRFRTDTEPRTFVEAPVVRTIRGAIPALAFDAYSKTCGASRDSLPLPEP